jgi:hypothetical protein
MKDKLKRWHKSWTVKANLILAFLYEAGGEILAFMPSVAAYMDNAEYNKWMLRLTVFVNIVMRFKTKTDMADK